MKASVSETYALPLYEKQLLPLSWSHNQDTEPEQSSLTEGTLTVKEFLDEQDKGSISIVHEIGDAEVGRYRFNIIDRAARICRYAGTDSPPWEIYCAVTEFGYHPQTAPDSNRKYTFDLVHAGNLELLRRTEELDYEYLRGWGQRIADRLNAYLTIVTIEYHVGSDRVEEVYSFLTTQFDDEASPADALQAVFDEFDVEDPFIPLSVNHPSTKAAMSTLVEQGYLNDVSGEKLERGWKIVTQEGRDQNQNEFYISIIGADAIDRFPFQITDAEAGECVVQSGVVGDLPPYALIEHIRGVYEITNMPKIAYKPDLSYSELLVETDKLVRAATDQFPPESPITKQSLNTYLDTLELCLSIAATYETIPEEFEHALTDIGSRNGIEFTADTVSAAEHEQLDQITAAALYSTDNPEKMRQLAGTLMDRTRIEERRNVQHDEVPDLRFVEQFLGPNVEIS